MSKIITQKAEENKQISERIKSFMKRFDVSSALKSFNAVKIKGLAVSKRESEDPCSMGELFMCCTDELADVSFSQAFSLLMDLFVSHAKEFLTISEQGTTNFVDKFL